MKHGVQRTTETPDVGEYAARGSGVQTASDIGTSPRETLATGARLSIYKEGGMK
jgi:hypothetical protein